MSKKRVEKVEFGSITWVINNLPSADLERVENVEISALDMDNFMSQEIENGGQFSFKFDPYSSTPQLSLMYLVKGHHHTGYALSARGETFEHCVRILMYKFFEVAKGDLTQLTEVKRGSPKYG